MANEDGKSTGLFLDRARVPVARFFAAGHGKFAAFVPGGHTDIFREKKNIYCFSFCSYSSLFFTIIMMSFPVSFIFPLNSSKL